MADRQGGGLSAYGGGGYSYGYSLVTPPYNSLILRMFEVEQGIYNPLS